jgi:hypothetical protein
MIKIEVKSADTIAREITAKNGPNAGRKMTFHEQDAYAFTSDDQGNPRPYPQRITLNIDRDKGQQPYGPGMYIVCPSSVFVDRFSNLQLGRLKLRPITQAVQAAIKAA